MKVTVIVLLVLAATPARAQPGNYVPVQQPAPVPVNQVNEDVALGLSLGGTVLSWGLLIGAASTDDSESDNAGLAMVGAIGTFVAPSFGHWYSHSAFTRGFGLRALGLGAGVVGIGMALDSTFSEDNSDEGGASMVLLLGAALYIAGTVDDIATAGSAARKYNSRFRDFSLVPAPTPHGGGVALVGRF